MAEPTIPPTSSLQPQSAQSPVDVRDGVFLSRLDGKKDLVPVAFPAIPVRVQVYSAFRFAIGFRDDEEEEPSGEFNGADATACCWAALGVCWRGKDVGLPSFREQGRDVVAYGELVTTALVFAGYGDVVEQRDAGKELMAAFNREVSEAIAQARAGFPKAKPRR